MEIKVGCCGFPGGMGKYFEMFSLVEVQKTFYKPPRTETAYKWKLKAPENFEFTVKAWQIITHPASSPTYRKAGIKVKRPERCGFFKPSREVCEAWEKTLNISKALNARVVVFQCPASFKPLEENLSNMREFFSSIDREGLVLVWEPRGEWDRTLVKRLCRKLNLVHCSDPFLEKPILTGEVSYMRLHGYHGGRMYYHDYTKEELKSLLSRCFTLSSSTVYCLFNNIQMMENALEFKNLLKGLQPSQGQV